ncbi:hypothetical protein BGW39_002927 [Mortierella sp. 14UC]|nr:hypothetical protein BGW39_002927 [Mortierella sp. 14UC]
MGGIGTFRNAGKGGVGVKLDTGKTTTTKQKDGVTGQAMVPTAAVAGAGARGDQAAATTPDSPIWVRRAEDEMDDPLDFYPDEDEDDPLEAASFISWLAQASLTAWSEFFDLDEFRRRTGLNVVEYQDLRDRGSFRGLTGVQESRSSVGASWIPLWVKEASAAAAAEAKEKRGDRYQHSLGTGTAVVDMAMPCHITCGFGSKRDLDFTAKAFFRQWGFDYRKQMLLKSPPPTSPPPSGSTVAVGTSPIDQTRDLDRIVAALQDDSLKRERLLCVSNTYKIQISPAAIPASSLVDSIEWHEFGQHLLFQPKLTQFADEFLDKTFGEHPEEGANTSLTATTSSD